MAASGIASAGRRARPTAGSSVALGDDPRLERRDERVERSRTVERADVDDRLEVALGGPQVSAAHVQPGADRHREREADRPAALAARRRSRPSSSRSSTSSASESTSAKSASMTIMLAQLCSATRRPVAQGTSGQVARVRRGRVLLGGRERGHGQQLALGRRGCRPRRSRCASIRATPCGKRCRLSSADASSAVAESSSSRSPALTCSASSNVSAAPSKSKATSCARASSISAARRWPSSAASATAARRYCVARPSRARIAAAPSRRWISPRTPGSGCSSSARSR